MMNIFSKYWNWCCRFRYRKGYGVHSPSDFYLITSVIYEKLPYYAYEELGKLSHKSPLGRYREKVNRLLFRLVNHFQPRTMVELSENDGISVRYMRAARPSMEYEFLACFDVDLALLDFEESMQRLKTLDMLHISHTPGVHKIFEAAYPYFNEKTCLIVGNIHEEKEVEEWWKKIQEDERARITFDLYDIGIVLFDPKRIKQNYIVNFL